MERASENLARLRDKFNHKEWVDPYVHERIGKWARGLKRAKMFLALRDHPAFKEITDEFQSRIDDIDIKLMTARDLSVEYRNGLIDKKECYSAIKDIFDQKEMEALNIDRDINYQVDNSQK